MKRFIVLALLLCAAPAYGQARNHSDVGLGFHHAEAPLGARIWMNDRQSFALDFGVGISSNDTGDDSETDVTVDFGVPLRLKTYESDAELLGDEVERGSKMSVLAELEVEAFILDNFSVSASHGVGVFVTNPPEEEGGEAVDSRTDFGTFGNNLTEVGFRLYGVFGE